MENIEQQNSEFYTRLAANWWDKQGPFWPIHTLNAVRTAYLRDWIARHFNLQVASELPLRDIRILDMGCGGGVLSESMACLGADVIGVDVVERNIQVARRHAVQEGLDIDYRISSADALVAAGDSFDVVLKMEVVEHVANLKSFMQSCNQLVRPGGLMFIATINRTLTSWVTAIIGAEYILGWLPRGTHQWHKFPKPGELEPLLRHGELLVLERVGVLLNPFSRRMRLSAVTAVNYMLVASKTGVNPAQAASS